MKLDTSPTSKQIIEIDDLEFMKTIGKGNTSIVRTARNTKSNTVFAVKQFKNYSAAQQDLKTETAALQALHHPNIIKLEAFDKRSLVFEYLPNGELFDLISKSKMPENIAKFYFSQLMSAISYTHDSGFAHRDVKLENILIANDFSLKLSDFGFAAPIFDGQKFEKSMGTEGYMAPELQTRSSYDGKKVDIFAAGVVLFCMVNGIPPFFKATRSDPYYRFFIEGNTEAYWNHLAKKFNYNLSDSFKDLITKMLSVNPEDRIQSSEIFSHPWLSQEPVCSAEEANQFVKDVLAQQN